MVLKFYITSNLSLFFVFKGLNFCRISILGDIEWHTTLFCLFNTAELFSILFFCIIYSVFFVVKRVQLGQTWLMVVLLKVTCCKIIQTNFLKNLILVYFNDFKQILRHAPAHYRLMDIFFGLLSVPIPFVNLCFFEIEHSG